MGKVEERSAEENEGLVCLIALLVRHEEAIAKLYKKFAENFPDERQFWLRIASEETKHATWIRALWFAIEAGTLSVNCQRFDPKSLQTSLDYLEVLLAEASQKMSRKMALSTALQIENSLIEKSLFETYEGDDAKARKVFQQLANGALSHIRRLEKALRDRQATSS